MWNSPWQQLNALEHFKSNVLCAYWICGCKAYIQPNVWMWLQQVCFKENCLTKNFLYCWTYEFRMLVRKRQIHNETYVHINMYENRNNNNHNNRWVTYLRRWLAHSHFCHLPKVFPLHETWCLLFYTQSKVSDAYAIFGITLISVLSKTEKKSFNSVYKCYFHT